MPYYQYDMDLERKLASNASEVDKMEKSEEERFIQVLSKEENPIITLLDLFFPPRFWKTENKTVFYPTLPTEYRKAALEFLQRDMTSGKIPNDFDNENLSQAFKNILNKEYMNVTANNGFGRLYTFSVIEYDNNRWPIIKHKSPLTVEIKTDLFIDLLIEHQLFPLELLYFPIVFEKFMEWNQTRLERLNLDLPTQEGWLLTDAISMLTGIYALPKWTTPHDCSIRFPTSLSPRRQPLRGRPESRDNSIESQFDGRVTGRIDNRKLFPGFVKMGERWNEVLKEVQTAMKLGKIKHTGGELVGRPNIKVDGAMFADWAERRGFELSRNLKGELCNFGIKGHQKSVVQPETVTSQPTVSDPHGDNERKVWPMLSQQLKDIKNENQRHNKKGKMKVGAIQVILKTIETHDKEFNKYNMPGTVEEFYDLCVSLAPSIFPHKYNKLDIKREKEAFRECCKCKKMKWVANAPLCAWPERATVSNPDFWAKTKILLIS